MRHWLDDLVLLDDKQACVLVSVIRTQGSCPRDSATRMIVTSDATMGTIGGGHLEYKAISKARDILQTIQPTLSTERYPLGARLGQCCGGVAHLSFEYLPLDQPGWINDLHKLFSKRIPSIIVSELKGQANALQDAPIQGAGTNKLLVFASGNCIGKLSDATRQSMAVHHAQFMLANPSGHSVYWQDELLFERVSNDDFSVAVFGAGHVGRALVNVLSTLPCRVRWFDSREGQFDTALPAGVQAIISECPEDEVNALPQGCQLVVMTHSHTLDQAICERALLRGGFDYIGLIGSDTKRRQFEKRLLARGVTTDQLTALTCPIGVDAVSGKHPARIAVAVAAQMLQVQSRSQLKPLEGYEHQGQSMTAGC